MRTHNGAGTRESHGVWRAPREARAAGEDAICRLAERIDADTAYVDAGEALRHGLEVWQSGALREAAPSVHIGGRWFGLTQHAALGLAERVGISARHLVGPEGFDPSANALLDAACASGYGARQMEGAKLVVDTSDEAVYGVVSASYVQIPHARLTGGLALDGASEATVRGTALRVREGKPTVVRAKGGDRGGDDLLKIYAEGANGHAGERAFGVGSYVLRTVCRNGLMAVVRQDRYAVQHRGKRETLEPAIAKILAEAQACIEQTRRAIKQLIAIPVTARGLASSKPTCEALATSLETLRSRALANELRTASRKNDRETAEACVERMIAETGPRGGRAVLDSPYRENDATAWDIVNLATSAARQLHPEHSSEREEAETSAGALARALIAEGEALEA